MTANTDGAVSGAKELLIKCKEVGDVMVVGIDIKRRKSL
jgi:hypothetical protein